MLLLVINVMWYIHLVYERKEEKERKSERQKLQWIVIDHNWNARQKYKQKTKIIWQSIALRRLNQAKELNQ